MQTPDIPSESARRSRRLDWTGELIRFGVVGAIGFGVNVSALYAARAVAGLYVAGLAAWLAAATVTWLLNRVWTFRKRARNEAIHKQWAMFVAANLVGFLLYYGTYVSLVTFSSFFAAQPVAAVFAGMLAGVAANFSLSRSWVFGSKPPAQEWRSESRPGRAGSSRS
jgi:putative flippase GtrA